MRRVVITGLGILSSIGNNKQEVTQSLKKGRSGIEFCQQFADYGLKSQVAGTINLDIDEYTVNNNASLVYDLKNIYNNKKYMRL